MRVYMSEFTTVFLTLCVSNIIAFRIKQGRTGTQQTDP